MQLNKKKKKKKKPTRQLLPKIKLSPPKAHSFYESLITLFKLKGFQKVLAAC